MSARFETPFLDAGLWSTVLRSRSFWLPQDHGALFATFSLSLVSLSLLICLPLLSARRRRIRDLHGDEKGSTTMLDFVLVTPLFVFFMFVVFQFAILAKNHLFTHYAAYMAARSARVYMCPQFPISTGQALDVYAFKLQTCDSDKAPAKAETAARIALIPAAPFKTLKCISGCQAPEAVLKAIAQATGVSSRWGAIQRQARYMFDKDNVKVQVDRAPAALYALIRNTRQVPVVAKVEARFLLLDYAGWLFADGKRKDGRYYTISRAEVTLL